MLDSFRQCGNNAQSVRFAVAATDSPPDLLSLELLQMGAEVQLLHIWGITVGLLQWLLGRESGDLKPRPAFIYL